LRKVVAAGGWLLLCVACGGPPKEETPALTPQLASELLHYNNNAQNWLTHVKKQNPACDYQLILPAQNNHPTQIDLSHIVWCQGAPSPTEYDASVSFEYDKAAKRWVIRLFTS
jgi:hypothetical protein